MTAPGHQDLMETLLKRSQEFEEAVFSCFPVTRPALSNRKYELVEAACTLCVEHCKVLRSAFALSAPNSGSALLRLQYESLLRAVWLMFAASPEQIEILARTLDLEAEQQANKLPGSMDMLKAVIKTAPKALTAPLAEFNQYSRHALNSFVHGGIHPLQRTQGGYPREMALTVVRFSNALMHFAYRLLASLGGTQQLMDLVTRTYTEFPDCVPMVS